MIKKLIEKGCFSIIIKGSGKSMVFKKRRIKYVGQNISVIITQMRYGTIDKEIEEHAKKWYVDVDVEDVRYEAYNYRDGVLANANTLKGKADYTVYKDSVSDLMLKFKFRKEMIEEFKNELMENVSPVLE